ncbi:MAG: hypothetical protein GYA51_01015 [Candidatus Methanofastidiosa archaeon]|nr:hypothetical protein [Candidatus Methanofastidiosa archaeon]
MRLLHRVNKIGIKKYRRIFVLSVSIAILTISIYAPAISIPPLPISEYKLNISNISMNNSGNGHEIIQKVKIIEIKIDDKAYPFTSCQISGNWVISEESLLLGERGKLNCSFSKRINSFVYILMEKDPKAGIVRIQYDGNKPIDINLFSDKPEQVLKKFSNIPFELFIFLYCCEILFLSWFVFLVLVYLQKRTENSFLRKIKLSDVSNFVLLFFILTLVYYQIKVNIGFQKILGGWNYFTGNQGAISAYGPVETYGIGTGDRTDISTCLEIQHLVPGEKKVLNLNGFAAVEPCLFSPLLPRDKIVHHYETVAITGPYFHELMYGEPEIAYSLYKRLGINYFYVRKYDTLFMPFGYSNALNPKLLTKNFEVFGETKDFYILTWHGNGKYPISEELSKKIEFWYNESKDQEKTPNNIWWRGKIGLDNWINR